MRYSIGLVVLMMFTFSQQASAQDYSFYNQMFSNMLSDKIWDNIYKQSSPGYSAARKNSARSGSTGRTSTNEVPAYRQYPKVQFKSTGTRLTVNEFAELIDPVPADRPETRRMLSGILEKYEAAAAAKGYPNDLALAIVSYIGLNAHVYSGSAEKPIVPFEQNVGLRDTIAEAFTDNGTFNNKTDQEKQKMYEVLVMISGLTYHFHEKAIREKNAEELKTCKLAAKQNLERFGIKP